MIMPYGLYTDVDGVLRKLEPLAWPTLVWAEKRIEDFRKVPSMQGRRVVVLAGRCGDLQKCRGEIVKEYVL